MGAIGIGKEGKEGRQGSVFTGYSFGFPVASGGLALKVFSPFLSSHVFC